MHFIILAAGAGKRMYPLTDGIPKALLPLGSSTLLSRLISQITQYADAHITVVAGYNYQAVVNEVSRHSAANKVRVVVNDRYQDDVNILSAKLGMQQREGPCTIVEADMILHSDAFAAVASGAASERSVWYTRGRFKAGQYGGIAAHDQTGRTLDVRFEDRFDDSYAHYRKLLGILSVGMHEWRRFLAALDQDASTNVKQYYMMPWVLRQTEFPSYVCDISPHLCATFNTVDEFEVAVDQFS